MTATTSKTALIIGASHGLGSAQATEYLALGGPAVLLTIGQSMPGVAGTIGAQAGKGGLQYLDSQGRTVRW